MMVFDKTFQLIKNPLFILFYASVAVVSYFYFDRAIATFFYQLDTRNTFSFLRWLTVLGESKIYVVVFLIMALFFRLINPNKKYEGQFLYMLGCVLIATLSILVLKIVFGRARPDLFFSEGKYGFYWLAFERLYWSFPSAHAVTVTSLACGLGVLIPRYFSIFLSLAMLVILTRIALCQHYLSDVMTGFYLGILTVGFFTAFLKKIGFFKKYNLHSGL